MGESTIGLSLGVGAVAGVGCAICGMVFGNGAGTASAGAGLLGARFPGALLVVCGGEAGAGAAGGVLLQPMLSKSNTPQTPPSGWFVMNRRPVMRNLEGS